MLNNIPWISKWLILGCYLKDFYTTPQITAMVMSHNHRFLCMIRAFALYKSFYPIQVFFMDLRLPQLDPWGCPDTDRVRVLGQLPILNKVISMALPTSSAGILPTLTQMPLFPTEATSRGTFLAATRWCGIIISALGFQLGWGPIPCSNSLPVLRLCSSLNLLFLSLCLYFIIFKSMYLNYSYVSGIEWRRLCKTPSWLEVWIFFSLWNSVVKNTYQY